MDLITISGYNNSNGVNNGFHKWSTLINGCLIREKPTNHAYFIVILNCGYNGGFMIYIYIYTLGIPVAHYSLHGQCRT